MADAAFAQNSFLGGEVSQSYQGRFELKEYRTMMNVCLNSFPMEQGAWTRRPGTRFLGTTRGGVAGRLISFDFKQSSPYVMEFTAGFLRFFAGSSLVMTNDAQVVLAISATTPAVVTTTTAHGWTSGNQVAFNSLGANDLLLQNRLFTITVLTPTTFSIADAIGGLAIDGGSLGTFVSGNVTRVLEIATPYATFDTIRSIQADIPTSNSTTPGAVLLKPTIKPYVLQVLTPPTATTFATFSFAPVVFKDGPYFDLVPGGTLATPSAKIGVITLTLSFNAFDVAKAYSIGDYVVNGGVNYKSLTDANVGSAPPSANWVAVSAADAIGPNGFVGTDIGRMVRLYSEPPIWLVGTAYVTGDVVAYGGSGVRYDGATYWKAIANSTGSQPGLDLTKWALFPTGAIWSWGKITALTNTIDRALAGSLSIGDMTSGGGLAAAFDGNLSQAGSASANKRVDGGFVAGPSNITLSGYVGKNYSGAAAQAIAQAILYPSNDFGLLFTGVYPPGVFNNPTIVLNLRAKATVPGSASDGTLLGTTGSIVNTTAPQTIISSDQTTTWNYVWIEMLLTLPIVAGQYVTISTLIVYAAELAFISPAGTGSAAGVSLQILGDPLLYTGPVRTWRLGLYSDTTTWPTCGTYHEGRLWLSGAIANRIDSSKSNDPFNFAPTNPDGTVPGNSGISYTFAAPDINPIFWMVPDQLGIICGTQAGEWLIQATSANAPLTPATIQAHRATTNQCANIEPRRSDLTLAVVQAYKRELLEYFADVYSGKFTAADLAEAAKHLNKSGIQEIAYQPEIIPIMWSRCGDGSLIGVTYKRRSLVSSQPPEMRGWHRHVLGSGRTIESIAAAATSDGVLPTLAMITNDVSGVRHVEVLTKVFEETDALESAWFLDDAVMPASTSTSSTSLTLPLAMPAALAAGGQRFAANRARWLTSSDTVNKQLMTRSGHKAWVDMTQLRIYVQNSRNSPVNINNDLAEFGFGTSATVTASIEYPAGTFTQVTFSGIATATVADKTILVSDTVMLPVTIPAGHIFWVRQFWTSAGGILYNAWQDKTSYGDAVQVAVSGLTDQTMGGAIADNSGWSHPPAAIIAFSTLQSIGIVGDSIGYGNAGIGSESPPFIGDIGVVAKTIAPIVPFQNLSLCGARAFSGSATRYWIGNGTPRRTLLQYCTHIICQLGINDLNNADGAGIRTSAQLQSDLTAIWAVFQATYSLPASAPIMQTTITPLSTSTDGWLSTTGQTTSAINAERVLFDTAVRATLAGTIGFYDVAAALESSLNSGLWKVGTGANMLADANNFSTASWVVSAASVANSVSDAFGGFQAWTLTENSGAGPHYTASATHATAPAGTYTFTVYAKGTTRRVELRAADAGGTNFCYVVFDLAGSQVGTTGTGGAGFTNSSQSITSVGGGWFRLRQTYAGTAATGSVFVVLDNGVGLAALSQNYVGDGVSFTTIMDAQLEAGSSATAWVAGPVAPTLDGLHPTNAGYTAVVTAASITTAGVAPGGLTINGLWHLNGQTCTVFAGGYDLGDFVVIAGSVFVPYSSTFTAVIAAAAVAAGQVVIGFTYNSDGQIVRPATSLESGARNGPALGKKRRTQRYGILVTKTAGMSIATEFANLKPILFKSDANVIMAAGQTFSGVYWDSLTDNYSFDSMVCWRISRPLPAMLAALESMIHTQDQ